MMFSRAFVAAACAAVVLLFTGCSGSAAEAEPITAERPLRIVTTIRPLELIVRDLLADSAFADVVEVAALMSPDVSPHGFEPTPAQVGRLRRADVVVYNGFGLDDWAGRNLPGGTRVICFADVADLDHHHHHHHHDHVHGPDCNHGPIDEHFWLDHELVSRFAMKLTAELGRTLGGEAAINALQPALQRFQQQVAEVHRAYQDELSAYQDRRIITHHNVFSRIAEHYGLAEPVVLRPLAVLEPTPGDLRKAIEAVRQENIQAILIEPQFSADAARQISRETGVRLVEVDPQGAAAKSWRELMDSILRAIVQSMQPPTG